MIYYIMDHLLVMFVCNEPVVSCVQYLHTVYTYSYGEQRPRDGEWLLDRYGNDENLGLG